MFLSDSRAWLLSPEERCLGPPLYARYLVVTTREEPEKVALRVERDLAVVARGEGRQLLQRGAVLLGPGGHQGVQHADRELVLLLHSLQSGSSSSSMAPQAKNAFRLTSRRAQPATCAHFKMRQRWGRGMQRGGAAVCCPNESGDRAKGKAMGSVLE